MSYVTVSELKTFKKLTGGDSVFAEYKGKAGFEYTFGGLLWFCSNELPRFGGDDGKWVYNRIMAVHCTNVIPLERQDKLLLDKMFAECEGIVYKAVLALRQVIANGYRFDEPESVLQAREEYRAENNTVISFWKECVVDRPQGRIVDSCTTSKMYGVYRAWCGDNNNGYAKTEREFRKDVSSYLGAAYKDLTVHTEIGTCFRAYTLDLEVKKRYRQAYGCDDVSNYNHQES